MDNRAAFKLTPEERRFPRPSTPTEILFKACLYCRTGDLSWDWWLDEWGCLSCGWREFEALRRTDEDSGDS